MGFLVAWKISKPALAWLIRCSTLLAFLFALFAARQVLYPRVVRVVESAEKELHQLDDLKTTRATVLEKISQLNKSIADLTDRQKSLGEKEKELRLAIDQQANAVVAAANSVYLKKKAELESQLATMDQQKPGWILSSEPIWKRIRHDARRKAIQSQLDALQVGKTTLSGSDALFQQLDATTSEKLTKQEELIAQKNQLKQLGQQLEQTIQSMQRMESSFFAELRTAWTGFKPWIFYLLIPILFGNAIYSSLMFWGVAPVASQQRPLQFARIPTTSLKCLEAQKTYDVRLLPGESLWTRMAWLSQHGGASKETSPWWQWKALGISFASGMVPCTKVTNPTDQPVRTALTSTQAEIEIAEIALDDQAEIVLHPRHIVAIRGPIQAEARWRLFHLHAWLTGQIRYLIFRGPGSLYVAAPRGVDSFQVETPNRQRISQSLVVGFDTKLSYSVDRTETFWPYYRGVSSLFDDCFEGEGTVLRQHALETGHKSVLERSFGFFFSALGKLLGF